MRQICVLGKWFAGVAIAASCIAGPVDAQWETVDGPYGGWVTSFHLSESEWIAGTTGGLYRSSDQGGTWSVLAPLSAGSVGGVIREGNDLYITERIYFMKSTDNGATWPITVPVPGNGYIWTMNRIGNYFYVAANSGLHRTSDDGATWETITPPGITFSFCIEQIGQSLYLGASGGLYRSDDGGENWTNLTEALGFVNVRAVTEHNGVLAAGTLTNGVLISTDGGTTWTEKNQGLGRGGVYDVLSNDNRLFAGTSGSGVYVSTDDGATWELFGLNGMDVATLGSQGSSILVGTWGSSLFATFNNGASWKAAPVQAAEGRVSSLLEHEGSVMATLTGGGVFRLGADGQTWEPRSIGLGSRDVTSIVEHNGKLYLSANNEGGVWVSDDDAATWQIAGSYSNGFTSMSVYRLASIGPNLYAMVISGGLLVSKNDGVSWEPTAITTGNVLVLEEHDGIIYAGTQRYGLFISNDGGASFEASWTGSSTSFVKDIVFTVELTFLGTSDGVFRSTNRGVSWEKVPGMLPTAPVFDLMLLDGAPVVALNGGGLYASTDHGDSWYAMNDGLDDLRLRCLLDFDGYIYGGTEMNGVWRIPITVVSVDEGEGASSDVSLSCTPNPVTSVANITFHLSAGANVDLNIMDMTGQTVTCLHSGWLQPGVHAFTWHVAGLPSGYFYVDLTTPRTRRVTDIIVTN